MSNVFFRLILFLFIIQVLCCLLAVDAVLKIVY